jgi:hypothetical protein
MGRIIRAAMSQFRTPHTESIGYTFVDAGRAEPRVSNADGMVVGALSRAEKTTMYGAGR